MFKTDREKGGEKDRSVSSLGGKAGKKSQSMLGDEKQWLETIFHRLEGGRRRGGTGYSTQVLKAKQFL